jgi:integrase
VPKRTLTAASVERIKPPAKGQVDVFDAGYPGLALRVSYGGRKSWAFFYRIGGRLRRMSLGPYPAISLAQARDAWREARKSGQAGQDPSAARKQSTGPGHFEAVLEEWFKRDQSKNRSAASTKRLLNHDAVPAWRYRLMSDIKRSDIMHLLDEIVDRGSPITARRLHAHLNCFFNWSVARGYIDVSPMMHLPKPAAERKRDRVLSDEELSRVWKEAEKLGWPFGAAIQLLILTGARRQEIGGLRRSELKSETIELSGARTKNGQPHSIPLSPPALHILETVPRVAGSDFVFTTNGKVPISAWARIKAQIDHALKLPDWRIHDLRRTVATGLQKLKTPLEVTEAVLGHTSGSRSGIVGVYQRYDYADEKRAALNAWGHHVHTFVQQQRS